MFAAAFIITMAIGIFRYATDRVPFIATAINIMWGIFDLSLLKVLIPAVLCQGSQPNQSLANVEGSS